MNSGKDPDPTETVTSTASSSVDLGDDLIANTADIPNYETLTGIEIRPQRSKESEAPLNSEEKIKDQLQSVQILVSEGLFDEAKRILRQILVLSANHVEARKRLTEIQD